MARLNQSELNWHQEVLPGATMKALDFLAGEKWLIKSSWYLAGGTALALQAGHRRSIDLDFFSPHKSFSHENLIKRLPESDWVTDILREGTLYGRLFGGKVSFIAYPFFKAGQKPLSYGAVRVLQPRDIAVMKIIAISQRGKKRDFIDLYWYVKNQAPLIEVLRLLPSQYPTVAHNYYHIIKALIYFADADDDPMPRLYFEVNWQTVKNYFEREVPPIARQILGLK